MKTHKSYPSYKTARQWAELGYLPIKGAKGIRLWSNSYCSHSFVYFSPDEVEKASQDQLSSYFAPLREKRNLRVKAERARKREEAENRARIEQRHAESNIIKPYLDRVSELIHYMFNGVKSVGGTFIIDTETTGLDPEKDEILQISIINGKGTIIFSSYVKPQRHSEWPEAEKVNGITPELVSNALSIQEILVTINVCLCIADTLVGYNLPFDLDFLQNNGVVLHEGIKCIDLMPLFAKEYGEICDNSGGYKYQSLTTAANYYGYDWRSGSAHNSLNDCFATLHVFNHLFKEEG